ncbi:MAG: redoxin domain-containing protein [Flavobacteriaceae bacterium]|nr:redoxin domain-containing protein [Flavobacteriaceae bacterium]
MKSYIACFICFVLVSCRKEPVIEIHTSFNSVEKYLHLNDNKTYIVNFWATWCAPCVKELPDFEELYHKYRSQNVELLLVSLDFPHQYESKLKPFMITHNLKGKVLCLDDAAMNVWIPKVDADWDGGLPATLIYNKDKREFFYRTFTFAELESELKHFLK